MSEITSYIKQLAEAKANWRQLIETVEQTPLMKNEEAQAFLFDLKDYSEALAVVTDLTKQSEEETQKWTIAEISECLGRDYRALQALKLALISDNPFSELSEGDIRRIVGSLDGLVELNGILLQDNRQFQQLAKEPLVEEAAPTTKKSFFQRILKK